MEEQITYSKIVFNKDFFLKRIYNDEATAKLIINVFVNDLSLQLKKLETFASKEEYKSLNQQAHTLKGATANLGAEELNHYAYLIEDASMKMDLVIIDYLLGELEEAILRFRNEVYLYLD